MNRSGRRAISFTIAAGVICGGAGMACAAPAAADPAATESTDSAAAGKSVSAKPAPRRPRGRVGAPRRGFPAFGIASPDVRVANAPAASGIAGVTPPAGGRWGRGDAAWAWWPWPCPWPIPPAPVLRAGNVRNNNNGLIIPQLNYVPPVVPVAQISGGVQRAETGAPIPPKGLIPEGLSTATAPAAVSAALTPAALPAAGPAAVGIPAATPPRPVAPAAVAPPPAAPPTPPQVTTGLAPQRQDAGSEPPASWRLGYPEELREADLAKAIALALPGLAAIAGMTALGGVVGYRQAKAGYMLPAAGAGRFLR